MRKYIHIDKRSRELLQKAFGITSRAVFNALHYEHESDGSELMRIVRATALARGGVVMIEAPADAALIDGGGYMRQTLPGGVLIEFRYADNSCTVYYRGEARERYDDVSLCDIPYIQAAARLLCGAGKKSEGGAGQAGTAR